ncbi:hypothetical protein NE865_06828 [Phthorimaea operculella]|nr:hypothetical protein NE865_06828 [Phthorimaea operculella]
METLRRISLTFDEIKKITSNKTSPEFAQALKRDLQILSSELQILSQENHELFIRSLAMEAYVTLLTVKSLPMNIHDKLNILYSNFEKLKPFKMREECLFIFLRTQNLLCYYLIQLEKIDTCRDILESMEELYDKTTKHSTTRFIDTEDLFSCNDLSNLRQVSLDKIDRVITNNIEMQAFVYNKMNMPEKYALYYHTTLRRQLEMKEGTPQDWAQRAARLGSYFTYLNQMTNARHHLCAAYYVLRTCHDRCKLVPEEFIAQKATFETLFLDLSHHWVKYGLHLFKLSKKKILNRYFNQTTDAVTGPDLWKTVDFDEEKGLCDASFEDENSKDLGVEKSGKGDYNNTQLFIFPTLNLRNMEAKVPCELVSDVEEARQLFMFTHKWLMRAKRYYNFESQTTQYTSCVLQLAELFEHLAFFEDKIDNQYSVQKRRADVLENLNSLLKSSDHMMTVQIDVIRELSQVQLELMALNLQKLWCEESQTNILHNDNDVESIAHSLDTVSNKTLTTKNLSMSSKNLFLRKMEAAVSINNRLSQLATLAPEALSKN